MTVPMRKEGFCSNPVFVFATFVRLFINTTDRSRLIFENGVSIPSGSVGHLLVPAWLEICFFFRGCKASVW